MTITDEEIMAYIDGELEAAERKRITRAALGDMDLADRIAAQRALHGRAQVQGAPIAQVIDMAAARAKRAARDDKPPARYRMWIGAAVAACAAIAVFGGMQRPRIDPQPIVARHGVLIASGDLGGALDTQLASAQDGAPIRMLGTFHRVGGDLCRVFAGPQASGVACHESGEWQLQHILPGGEAQPLADRKGGSQDAALMALARTMAQGAPLDAYQERGAQARGWQ